MNETDSASPTAAAAATETNGTLQTEDEYEQLKRFQIELEFVQCLSNPWYLHYLAHQQYFNQDAFVRYLDYLQYFRKPEYAKFIIYPHCLHFLTLLQHKSFRDHLAKQDTATFVHERQYYHWQYLRNQDKVVRMEIMPDGSMVEIKSETPNPTTPSLSDAPGTAPRSTPSILMDGPGEQSTPIAATAGADSAIGINGLNGSIPMQP